MGAKSTTQPGTTDWRSQAWRTIRYARAFTVPDLMRTFADETQIAYVTVATYVTWLGRAGYVRRCGRCGRHARYRLVRDTGPQAPTRASMLDEARRASGAKGNIVP